MASETPGMFGEVDEALRRAENEIHSEFHTSSNPHPGAFCDEARATLRRIAEAWPEDEFAGDTTRRAILEALKP